jgi:hypothetical protein
VSVIHLKLYFPAFLNERVDRSVHDSAIVQFDLHSIPDAKFHVGFVKRLKEKIEL